jgi:signal transduction histidine kinase
MSYRAWFRPPRHLLAVFLLITLAPSILLIVFGWRLLRQERALALQQVQLAREQAADLVVSSLDQSLSGAEQALGHPATLRALPTTEDAVAVTFTRSQVGAFPPGRLPYYPLPFAGKEAPEKVFAPGEELEHRRKDRAKAAAVFRELARSADPAIRAGALVRLARNLRKGGEREAALAAYAQAAKIQGAAVAGVPADLLARWARCGLLEEMGRSEELKAEARTLHAGLLQGRWQIGRGTYELHLSDAIRWMGDAAATAGPADGLRLAQAVEWLWSKWQRMPAERSRGRESIRLDDTQFTILWEGSPERLTAFVGGPAYVEHQWLGKLAPVLERQHVRVALRDPASRPVSTLETRRAAGETGLPWTVAVESTDMESELARLAGRRSLWLAGLALLGAMVIAGSYMIARAVTRELAVARLQSDFVSAVSHEFRTPLTSLRQLTEILLDRRITDEERRHTYYAALARQTERLHRLVESLLDFGRMEAGASPYRFEALEACSWIRSVAEQFESEVAGRGYHVEINTNGAVATIAGDREALANALWNLLDNAVKYSPESRTVWVNVEREEGRLAIRVRDQGLGIAPGEQKEIFRKFVRGSGAKVEGIKGTGIGLAMVNHIVKAHGGEVSVESQPGAGSTFTVLLPVVEPCHAS